MERSTVLKLYKIASGVYSAGASTAAKNVHPATKAPDIDADDRFINDLARQISVTENDSPIDIPVLLDGSLDMSGEAWYSPKMGIRTQINKDKYASALGTSQIVASAYLDAAKDGHLPASWFISNPKKMAEFYQLALDMRPEKNKKARSAAGVNSIGKALQQWQKIYGDDSIGDYGKYVLGIHTGTGVKHGEDAKLPIQFHRESYNMMRNILRSRLGAIRKNYPGISDDEIRNRLAYSWHKGPNAKYDQSHTYLTQFNKAGERIRSYKQPVAAVSGKQPVNNTDTGSSSAYFTVPPGFRLWRSRNDANINPNKLTWGELFAAYRAANPHLTEKDWNSLQTGTKLTIPKW